MPDYNDFTASNIFHHDKDGNIKYIYNNKNYIINDNNLQKKLKDIEGYRGFIEPERKRRFIAFLLTAPIFSILLLLHYKFFGEPTEWTIALLFYGTFSFIFWYIKYKFNKTISNLLQKCNILSEDIFLNKSLQNKDLIKNKTFIEKLKYNTQDFNILHIIIFIIIAFPFLFFIFNLIKNMSFGR